MARLGCACGHTIRDQEDNLPYKGMIMRDQQLDTVFDAVVQDLVGFITAKVEQRDPEWLAQYFREPYPQHATDHEIVHDVIASHFFGPYNLVMYQCEQCGRMLIEDHQQANHFRSFVPEGTWEGTLAVPRAE